MTKSFTATRRLGTPASAPMAPSATTTGRTSRKKSHVCRVEKPIYGMAQAGRRWQRSIFPWLLEQLEHGFTQSESDTCVFIKRRGKDLLLVGCYVDDLFTLYSDDGPDSLYHEFTTALVKRWKVEDESEINDILNVEITREGNKVVLRQTNYIEKLVADHLPEGVPHSFHANQAPADTDLAQIVADILTAKSDPAFSESIDPKLRVRFQSLVGALLYCSVNTRPDVAYAVGMLCRVLAYPNDDLYARAERVLFYLYRHRHVGLTYEASPSSPSLYGMSDSDWATKHSTSGWVFMYNSAAVSWGSKKQKSVALSSCEAEIMASSEAAKEAVYLDRFVSELGYGNGQPVSLATDNQAARNLAYNPEHHDRTKHIERRHFFIRELVEELKIIVPYVKTDENLADFLTKPLAPKIFFPLLDAIMNHVEISDRRQARGAVERIERPAHMDSHEHAVASVA